MTSTNYEYIALNWQPDHTENRQFLLIATIVLGICLLLAIVVNMVEVPNEPRQQTKVPDRVAQFIKKQPKPQKIEAPKPKAKPKPPPPPKPKVERKKDEPKKPLTKVQKEARAKAEKSGILALSDELSDLMDSSAVDAAVAIGVSNDRVGRSEIAGLSTDAIINSTGKGSGGVSNEGIIAGVKNTQLGQVALSQIQQSLIDDEKIQQEEPIARVRGDNVRSEEEVQVVFDRNKGRLQSIYLRERRKNPSLEGTIIFEITISPEGTVTNIRIVSSELNSPSLEKRLISRIKAFKFSSKSVEPVTVSFPIDFLP